MSNLPPPAPGDLCTLPHGPSSLSAHVFGAFMPTFLTSMVHILGVPKAFNHLCREGSLADWINPLKWYSLIFGYGFGAVLQMGDHNFQNFKRPLIAQAYGNVFEPGAGNGANLRYYDISKVDRIYALEPYAPLRQQLGETAQKIGLADKIEIIPLGLDEDRATLASHSVKPGSMDTILLCQVLCSIPDPQSHLSYLQSLLKPGGQILLFEHVAHKDTFARTLQTINTFFFKRIMAGCHLNRDSADWIADLGGWDKVEIQRPLIETTADLFPHAVARYVKAK